MKNVFAMCIVGGLALFSVAHAGENKGQGRYLAKPLVGDYYSYAGTLSEMNPPTDKDLKLSLMFTGPLAKDMFVRIGPDISKENICGSAPDYRERRKGDLSCTFTKDDGYSCYFGLNVMTGKSRSGSIC